MIMLPPLLLPAGAASHKNADLFKAIDAATNAAAAAIGLSSEVRRL